jgi:hypothetical protein
MSRIKKKNPRENHFKTIINYIFIPVSLTKRFLSFLYILQDKQNTLEITGLGIFSKQLSTLGIPSIQHFQ